MSDQIDLAILALLAERPPGLVTYVVRNSLQMRGSGNFTTRQIRRRLERLEVLGMVDRGGRTSFARMICWRRVRGAVAA